MLLCIVSYLGDQREHQGHKERPSPPPKRPKPKRQLLLIALMAALNKVYSIPPIELDSNKRLKKSLRRKLSKQGVLLTAKLSQEEAARVRKAVSYLPQSLVKEGDMKPLIVDSGASCHATGFKNDFIPGTLKSLDDPVSMDGIGATLKATHKGVLKYEFVKDDGTLGTFEGYGLYLPDMSCRLFSPQIYLEAHKKTFGKPPGHFEIHWDHSCFAFTDGSMVTMQFDNTTHLPILHTFQDATKVAESLLTSCVTDEMNQNLTSLQKLMLQWHFKLGHIGFQHLQWIARQGWLGKLAEKFGVSSVAPPKCAACQFGRQQCNPTAGSKTKKENEGALSKNKLQPGDLVFSDQYESRVPGRIFNARGTKINSEKYCGGTLFCDAATGLISVHHQISLTAMETIESKLKFEREAFVAGHTIKAYHTDNGVYTAKQFTAELYQKGQGITHSGVGGHHHNGKTENSIKIVVYMARTMMIHATLRWPEVSDKELWPMALSYAVYLYNHTPKQDTNFSCMELWTTTKSNHNSMLNAQPWGCPTYVLDPQLQDGHKIPKWQPRSRRGQFMGFSPLHASTVALVRNLTTGNISPQFHVVHDSYFETVHSSPDETPKVWPELIIFQSFKSDFEETPGPILSDEWLSADEKLARDKQTIGRRDAVNSPPSQPVPPDPDPVAPVQQPQQPQPPPAPPDQPSTTPTPPSSISSPRRSTRVRKPPDRLEIDPSQKSYAKSLFAAVVHNLVNSKTSNYDYNYLYALLLDPDLGLMDNMSHELLTACPKLLKSKGNDPDLPTFQQAMTGSYRQEFLDAMQVEIKELEAHNTWIVVKMSEVPKSANILPCTWVFRIKRYPDGRLRKFKARICARGDKQIEGVDYDETYSPVVSWSTVRLLLVLTTKFGWKTRQVDFSNAFVQAKLKEQVYMKVPAMFVDSERGPDEEVVLKLNKSLYGLVQAPKTWFEHLKANFEQHGLHPTDVDPCLFFGHGMMVLCYVDDCLFFGPDDKAIDEFIKKLEDSGMPLTREQDDIYNFLGVEVNPDSQSKKIVMTQKGLIEKVLKVTGMQDSNAVGSPANITPLGTDLAGKHYNEEWDYASVVGMLLYLASNTHPEIQFAVHQCARFTHSPKESHAVAVKKILRYLSGTRDKGIELEPSEEMTLDLYVDADFAGLWNHEDDQDPICVKSRTGYVITIGGFPLLWVSKLQTEIALSTCEAEYIALSQSMRDLLPMRRLLQEIGSRLNLDFANSSIVHSTVFEDNTCALGLATAPKMSSRTKHIALKYHFFRSFIGENKGIRIQHIDTLNQKADIFTKGLAPEKFANLRKLLIGW